jgi:hypothetical protein
MAVLIGRLTTPLRLGEITYLARVWGAQRDDGLWEGWIEFISADGIVRLSTGRETVQSSEDALGYWAGGLEPVYLDGALARAIDLAGRAHAA